MIEPTKYIGGYFELELSNLGEFHNTPYRYNLARTALLSLLKARKINSIYFPSYVCGSIIHACTRHKINVKFYEISDLFNFELPVSNASDEAVLLVNYFGFIDTHEISQKNKSRNLIIDNSQAFFEKPVPQMDSFYSPRKFFGVPDGAYLYTEYNLQDEYNKLPESFSENNISHLVGRIERGAEASFADYKKAQLWGREAGIQKMSGLSKRMLESINYENVKNSRMANYSLLHEGLSSINLLALPSHGVPLCYPLLLKNGNVIRQYLIENKIFVPQYWPDVLTNKGSTEMDKYLTKNLVCLPLDQRYSLEDMKYILNILATVLN